MTADGTVRRASRTENDGPVLGAARWRRQLRRRDRVRLPTPRGRSAGDGRRDRLAGVRGRCASSMSFARFAESAPTGADLRVVAAAQRAARAVASRAAHGTPVIMVIVCHSGTLEQAQADLAPIKSHGEPLADLIVVKDYVAQQAMLDATQPQGHALLLEVRVRPGPERRALRHLQRAVRRPRRRRRTRSSSSRSPARSTSIPRTTARWATGRPHSPA